MLHKCRLGYCLSDKRRDDDGNMECRFHFPMRTFGYDMNISADGRNIESIERNQLAKQGADIVKGILIYARNHPTLVHHVPELLTIWCANIEGRSVESYKQVIAYLMKYMMKAEPNSAPFNSICKAIIDDTDESQPVRKAMQKILMKTVGENDMSKQMCHHLLSGNEIVEFSKKPITVNITKTRIVNTEAGNRSAASENMADVYWRRETDQNYQQFLSDYENDKTEIDPRQINLYSFCSKFTKKWKLSGTIKFPHITPNFGKIPNKHSTKYHERYVSFLKAIILTHKAGTTFADIEVLSLDDLEAQVEEFCKSDECPNVIRDKYEESQRETNSDENDDEDDDDDNNTEREPELLIEPEQEDGRLEQDEWMMAVGQIVQQKEQILEEEVDQNNPSFLLEFDNVDWEQDRNDLNLTDADLKRLPKWLEDQKHENPHLQRDDVSNGAIPETLNEKQLAAFAILKNYILDSRLADDNEKPPQLLLNISGGAGSGKSYLLKVVKRYASEWTHPGFVLAAAPSGTAAFIINGETLHSMFYLPTDNRKFQKLKGDKLSQLQDRMKHVGLIFLDEKSMIGQVTFSMISQRLQEARPHACNEPFGGISIILMGDWVQLPPVFGKSLFDGSTNNPAGYNLYRLFKDVIILDVIERQQDSVFSEELRRLATGEFTFDDWIKWQSRTLETLPVEEKTDFIDNAIMACALKSDMAQHNIRKVISNQQPIAQINAECNCSEASKESGERACNLVKSITISKGTTIRITSNLWTSAGLTNGSVGNIHYIIYPPGTKPPKLPLAIIATFDTFLGEPYLPDLDHSVVITPVRREWMSNGITCSRTMLPIILGYALSIHRLQGQTEDKVILNPGAKEFAAGLMYVGASRTKTFTGLSFSPYPNFERFNQISKSPALKKRLEEENRMNVLQQRTLIKYSDEIQACSEDYN